MSPDMSCSIHVGIFGPVRVVVGQETLYLTGRPAQVIAHLAVRNGAAVSAERLLDLLWPIAPKSGLNALQRHVSMIRRRIRDTGKSVEANEIILYSEGSYRLDTKLVRTDLDLLRDPRYAPVGPSEARSASDVLWWLDPLLGLPYESFEPMRLSLGERARATAKHWLSSAPADLDPHQIVDAIGNLAERYPHDDFLRSGLRLAHQRIRNEDVRADGVRRPGCTTLPDSETVGARFSGLPQPISLWLTANVDDAIDLVQSHSHQMRADTAKRARRWFERLDPTDGLARSLITQIAATAETNPIDAERALVSLDAYALFRTDRGLDQARAELDKATANEENYLRSLRVFIFALLGAPPCPSFDESLKKLESIESPEAQAEAGRFRIAERIRKGDFEGIVDQLDRVQGQLDDLGPGQQWYRRFIRVALHEYAPTTHLVPDLEPEARFVETAGDQAALSSITLWHELCRGETNGTSIARLRLVASDFSIASTTAYETLYLLASGQVSAADRLVRPYRGRLATLPRSTEYHQLPVACGLVALAKRDQVLANEVAAALRPWSGYHLGNFEIIIGPTDDFLELLRRCDSR